MQRKSGVARGAETRGSCRGIKFCPWGCRFVVASHPTNLAPVRLNTQRHPTARPVPGFAIHATPHDFGNLARQQPQVDTVRQTKPSPSVVAQAGRVHKHVIMSRPSFSHTVLPFVPGSHARPSSMRQRMSCTLCTARCSRSNER